MKTLKISYRIARDNLGESDDQHAMAYVAALQSAIESEYPGATVVVNLKSDFANACQTFVEGDADEIDSIRENVGLIANRVWDRM